MTIIKRPDALPMDWFAAAIFSLAKASGATVGLYQRIPATPKRIAAGLPVGDYAEWDGAPEPTNDAINAEALAAHKPKALENVREQVRLHIEADWPIWRQINADAGIYPVEVKAQKDGDIAACITESNRVEDAIDAATDTAGVDAAVASLNLPTLPVVI